MVKLFNLHLHACKFNPSVKFLLQELCKSLSDQSGENLVANLYEIQFGSEYNFNFSRCDWAFVEQLRSTTRDKFRVSEQTFGS